MKVVQKKRDGQNVTLSITATPQEVGRALQASKEMFARVMGLEVDPNKTVDQAVFEATGIKDLDSMVADRAVEALIPYALDKKNIIPAYPPRPEITSPIKAGSEYKFTIQVALRPEYELTSYEPVEVELFTFKIDEGAIEQEIMALTQSYLSYKKDEEKDETYEIQSGDYVKLALEADEGGKRIDYICTDGRTYAVGKGHMPEGFDSNIIGMKVGETREFTFEAPALDENYQEYTQQVHAKATILEVQKEIVPELTDEWVKVHMPMFSSAKQMRDTVTKGLEMREREQYEAYKRQAVVAELAKRFEGKIADEVYESMSRKLSESLQMDLRNAGRSWEEFVEENGGEQQTNMLLMLQTREMLAQGYALDAVYRHFGLQVTDHDYEQVCHTMNPEVDPKVLRKDIEKNGQGFALRESAERFKANQYILDHAKITYKD